MSKEIKLLAPVELRAKSLFVGYGDTLALRVPELSVRGRVIAIIGHNGSGKSTFMKTLLDLLIPKAGTLEALFYGENGMEKLVPKHHMAFSPESGAVFSDLSVEAYIKLWCRIKTNDARYYLNDGAKFIEELGVSHLLSRLGRALSKGERRRVQTAIGFLTQPRLFLLDEPFSGLDVRQASELARIFRQESKSTAMFIASHRMDLVEQLADSVIVLQKGEVVFAGSVTEVCEQMIKNRELEDLQAPLTLSQAMQYYFADVS